MIRKYFPNDGKDYGMTRSSSAASDFLLVGDDLRNYDVKGDDLLVLRNTPYLVSFADFANGPWQSFRGPWLAILPSDSISCVNKAIDGDLHGSAGDRKRFLAIAESIAKNPRVKAEHRSMAKVLGLFADDLASDKWRDIMSDFEPASNTARSLLRAYRSAGPDTNSVEHYERFKQDALKVLMPQIQGYLCEAIRSNIPLFSRKESDHYIALCLGGRPNNKKLDDLDSYPALLKNLARSSALNSALKDLYSSISYEEPIDKALGGTADPHGQSQSIFQSFYLLLQGIVQKLSSLFGYPSGNDKEIMRALDNALMPRTNEGIANPMTKIGDIDISPIMRQSGFDVSQ